MLKRLRAHHIGFYRPHEAFGFEVAMGDVGTKKVIDSLASLLVPSGHRLTSND